MPIQDDIKTATLLNSWVYSYGEYEFQNLKDIAPDDTAVRFILLPVTTRVSGTFEDVHNVRYDIAFYLCVRSSIDEVYEDKYENNIKPLYDQFSTFKSSILKCAGLGLFDYTIEEVINFLDTNTDGLYIRGQLRLG